MSNSEKAIRKIYIENNNMFIKNAHYILKKFYSIPIDENDLILDCLQQLLRKAELFKPTKELTLEQYLLSNIKYIMFSYCRSFTRKNSAILNNYLSFDLVENYHSDTYKSLEINYDFLTTFQYKIFNDLFIKNLSIKEVAIKNTTTSHFIKNEVKKIRENINRQIENFVS
ncbi:MAG: hypothetical protein ACRCWU_00630 [Metamycoplasmataceae bacterium]